MVTLTFKVSEDEARRIRMLARREKLTVSEYLRRSAGAPGSRNARPRRVRCLKTGAMIFAAPSGQPPLTGEMVKEILGDFP